MFKTWGNGAGGLDVRTAIEYNFHVLGQYLPNQLLCLPTKERLSLSGTYLTEGLIVFDIDERIWMQYTGGFWRVFGIYNKTFSATDWNNGKIKILFDEHMVSSPIVQVYMKKDDFLYEVTGDIEVDEDCNITISSDIVFDGKVIIR